MLLGILVLLIVLGLVAGMAFLFKVPTPPMWSDDNDWPGKDK